MVEASYRKEDIFLAGISIKYNNVNWLETLNELSGGRATVTDVNRNVAANFNNNYQDQGMHRYGQQFLYSTLSVKQVSVSIKLVGNQRFFNEAAGLIGKFLNVTEPKKLAFSDEPDKVWEAIASGQPALAVDNSTSPATATITVTFDVPKSYSEGQTKCLVDTSSASRYGTITKIANDHYKIKLNNLGSAVAYPKFKIKHNSDNGWVGIVKSQTENYEIGSPEEADGKNVKNTETLLDYSSNNGIIKGLQEGAKNVAILNDNTQDINGTLAIEDMWGRPHLSLSDRGSGVQNNKGASVTWTIPADSNGERGSLNEYLWWRQIFWLGSPNQYGFMKICVSDANGEFLYGVETYKRASGLECEYNLMVSDGVGYRIPLRKRFLGTHLDNHNPFNATRGWSDLMRRDDEIRIYWAGTYLSVKAPEIKGHKSAKIHVFFGDMGNHPQVSHMYLDQIYYHKDFVDGWEDIPNRYHMGSVLEIDMAKGKTYVDNLPTIDGLAYLAEPFGLDPGVNDIDIYFSSWITKAPDIEVSWYERSV